MNSEINQNAIAESDLNTRLIDTHEEVEQTLQEIRTGQFPPD